HGASRARGRAASSRACGIRLSGPLHRGTGHQEFGPRRAAARHRMKVPACALLMLGVATSAQGADSLMLTGSTESSIGSYTYLGALMPLPHSVLGQGWVVRQWLYRLTYRY